MKFKTMTAALAALLFAGILSPAIADEHEGKVARMWQITAKADARDAFNEGFKAHMAWRKENKDPWGWNVYYASSGDGVNSVFVRSGGHHWKDFDEYRDSEFSKKAGEHWSKNVHPHVAHYDSSLAEADDELQHWPEEDADYRYFRVTTFYLKPGEGRKARAAVKAVFDELKAANWDGAHGWIWAVTGDKLPAFSVVSPRENWAGLDYPEEGVRDTLIKRLGEKKATRLFDDFFEHVKGSSSHVYSKDMELSYEAAE